MTRALLAHHKWQCPTIVAKMDSRGEVPATGQSPLPAYGSHAAQKVLEKVSPSNVLEYRAMLHGAGFGTLESLALPVAGFRAEVAGMKAGHARALINMVVEERARRTP